MDMMGGRGEEPYRASSLSLAYFELKVLMEAYTLAGKKKWKYSLNCSTKGEVLKPLTWTRLEMKQKPADAP